MLGMLCLGFCSPVYDWGDVTDGWLINAHIGWQGEAPLHLWRMELRLLGPWHLPLILNNLTETSFYIV